MLFYYSSLVGFGTKNRFIGEAAKNQEISNLKNTVSNLKRLIGKSSNDPELEVEKRFVSSQLVDAEGSVGAKVRYQGGQKVFTVTQLVAMYLNKIKNISAKEVSGNISDIAIAVPVWYTDVERRAIIDASIIAGLNPVRIVNDVTAAAVGYGVFKTDLPEDEPKKIAFVDIGHSSYSVSIASIKKGELKILGSAYDKHFGGRNFDYAIADHFAEEFKAKYKIDVKTNPKAFARVVSQSERLKKILSANASAPFNIESLMNDVDVSSNLSRDSLEEFVKPLLERIHVPIETALKDAGLKAEDIDTIEVIGGCTRVPSVKTQLASIFNKPLSFTLNQDEAIARGAAFICAIHSPTLRVRPFKFEDYNPYTVSFFWDKDEEDTDHLEVFPRGGSYPSTKVITLYRSKDFSLEAKYTNIEELPKNVNQWIGTWKLSGVVPNEGETSIATKIKLRNDPSGLYVVEAAYTAEEKIFEEPIEETPAENKEGAADEETEAPKTKKVKRWVKKNDLVITHNSTSLESAKRNEFFEKENELVMEDKLVADTEDRKNALEEYIYDLRGKIDDQYSEFASDKEKEKLKERLLKAEDWLYDDGYDATKAQYIAKYEELASIGNLIRGRYLAKEEEKKQAYLSKKEAAEAQRMAEIMANQRAANTKKDKDTPMPDA